MPTLVAAECGYTTSSINCDHMLWMNIWWIPFDFNNTELLEFLNMVASYNESNGACGQLKFNEKLGFVDVFWNSLNIWKYPYINSQFFLLYNKVVNNPYTQNANLLDILFSSIKDNSYLSIIIAKVPWHFSMTSLKAQEIR